MNDSRSCVGTGTRRSGSKIILSQRPKSINAVDREDQNREGPGRSERNSLKPSDHQRMKLSPQDHRAEAALPDSGLAFIDNVDTGAMGSRAALTH